VPRGKPRKGQYVVELVMPDGFRIKWESTKDLDVAMWCKSVSRTLAQATEIVDNIRSKSAETVCVEQGSASGG